MHLRELKDKSPTELLTQAEDMGIEDASSMRVQDLIFAIMKKLSEVDTIINGDGVIEVMQDGFGFLRSAQSNYLASADDIYVSPQQVKKYGLRTGDTVEGEIRAPKENERYFALTKINTINYDDPEKSKLRVNFDNLTPLYPTEKLNFDIICGDKDYTTRVIDLVSPQGKGQRGWHWLRQRFPEDQDDCRRLPCTRLCPEQYVRRQRAAHCRRDGRGSVQQHLLLYAQRCFCLLRNG